MERLNKISRTCFFLESSVSTLNKFRGGIFLEYSKIKVGFYSHDAHHADLRKREQNIIPSRPIIIEDNVFIGLESTILKGVKIGKNSVIGAQTVVVNNIPENSIAIGNPCKVIIKKKMI